MGAVGPSLEDDVVAEGVQLGSRGPTPVTVLLRNMPAYDQWVDRPVGVSSTRVPVVQPQSAPSFAMAKCYFMESSLLFPADTP
ncbi:hypothetical protein V500_09194 [Pseudogymnoascus sp. VKM F-4518 (FW-2643)]|nr:hypothetical protein V500_09194 [Pseudogymnoascus sp. VKM F-4518 (FW-2643)]